MELKIKDYRCLGEQQYPLLIFFNQENWGLMDFNIYSVAKNTLPVLLLLHINRDCPQIPYRPTRTKVTLSQVMI